MYGSRELEVTRKTKFRTGREEEVRKGGGGSKKNKHTRSTHKVESSGFDMWEDEPNDGC